MPGLVDYKAALPELRVPDWNITEIVKKARIT
jgi:hypothetical protein